jgi:hypothetical protein
MRLFITFFGLILLAGAAAAAQDKGAQKSGDKQETQKDARGVVEKKTPFGTAKYEEKAEPEREKEAPPSDMHATEDGDTVRFERRMPFGIYRWTKKKNELDETERAVVERERREKGKQ